MKLADSDENYSDRNIAVENGEEIMGEEGVTVTVYQK